MAKAFDEIHLWKTSATFIIPFLQEMLDFNKWDKRYTVWKKTN